MKKNSNANAGFQPTDNNAEEFNEFSDLEKEAAIAITPEAEAAAEEEMNTMSDLSAISLYFKEIGTIKILNTDEELVLAKKAANGDLDARNALVVANTKLVAKIAKKYVGFSSLPYSDLIQEGNQGLIYAAQKYDPSLGFRFSTYASNWILHFIMKALAEQGRTIRLPENVTRDLLKIRRAYSALTQKFGFEPSDEELAEETGMSLERIYMLNVFRQDSISFNVPIGEDGTDTLLDILPDDNSPSVEAVVMANALSKNVAKALELVPASDADLIRRSMGIGRPEQSLSEIAKDYGISKEAVFARKKRVFRDFKANEEAMALIKDFRMAS